MPVNVEIKAFIGDRDEALSAIRSTGAVFVAQFEQVDTFFNQGKGRLKLRVQSDQAELIYYEREDELRPRASRYAIHAVAHLQSLLEILSAALGVRGVVRKRRILYRLGNTRLHLDDVEGLGCFLELEVVLGPGQAEEEGLLQALALQQRLGIAPERLIARAYIDLLEEGCRTAREGEKNQRRGPLEEGPPS